MNTIKEKSLQEAFRVSGCRELPKAFNENGVDFWIKAIGYVKKLNGTTSYCLLEHAPNGKVLYVQDFGTLSPIFGLLSVHPYLFLDKNKYYPRGTKEAVISAVAHALCEDRDLLSACSDEELEAYKIRYAIKHQSESIEVANTLEVIPDEYGGCITTDPLSEYHKAVDDAESGVDATTQEVTPQGVMDEDGMITLISAKDAPDDDDEEDYFSKPKKEDDSNVVLEADGSTTTMTEIASAPKKRGRPRKADSKKAEKEKKTVKKAVKKEKK